MNRKALINNFYEIVQQQAQFDESSFFSEDGGVVLLYEPGVITLDEIGAIGIVSEPLELSLLFESLSFFFLHIIIFECTIQFFDSIKIFLRRTK